MRQKLAETHERNRKAEQTRKDHGRPEPATTREKRVTLSGP